MTFKANIDSTGRDFFFTPSGNNDLSGLSLETSVEDPAHAIALVNSLSQPPSPADPASINAAVTGAFTQNIVLPNSTSVNCSFASMLNFTPSATIITGGSVNESRWGAILGLANNTTCYLIDGLVRHEVIINAVVAGSEIPQGDDCIGFDVTGDCDDIFVRVVQAEIRGERSMLVSHTATSPSSINYHFDLVEMFDIDQTLMDYNPVPGSSQTIIEMTTAQNGEGATTTGCTLFKVRAGILVVASEVLACDTIANVFGGALLTLKAQAIAGDTLVQDGGVCIYKSASLLQGDMETQGSGTLQVDANIIIGNATNTGAMSIRADSFTGDIVNTGSMFAIIGEYIGTLPVNDGSINGIINGILYGNWREEVLLQGSDLNTQTPTGLDAPMQITFGAAQGSGSDPVMLSAAGVVTANVADQYNVSFFMQYGRTGAGMFSKLFFRILVNGTQVGSSIEAKLDNSNSDVPVQLSTFVPMVVGDELTAELVRDSGGGDSGELVSEIPVLAWNAAPSAIIRISR